MSKHYVVPLVEVTACEQADVLTYSMENYVEWDRQNWFGGNGGEDK